MQVSDLLGNFQFIPAWRVDDVMVSYAPKGGSVGPHVDNYDVFLLQVRTPYTRAPDMYVGGIFLPT